ncbi:MAG: hypothetical protein DRJ03_17050, partial [Chloroflexi bacterium]
WSEFKTLLSNEGNIWGETRYLAGPSGYVVFYADDDQKIVYRAKLTTSTEISEFETEYKNRSVEIHGTES